MTEPTQPAVATSETQEEHRASWLELFFDLVVVVAIATLTERIAEHADLEGLALVVAMYLAIWLVWTSFMLYANVAGEKTHRRAMLIAMACIAVMAAAVPAAEDKQRGTVFIVAYVVARVVAGRTWQHTGRVLVEWPIAQLSVGLAPWIASIWVGEPVRYYLWALGLALDMGYAIFADDAQRILTQVSRNDEKNERAERSRRRAERSGRTYVPEATVEYRTVDVERSHFGERLGTFTIIVLGEVVSQIVLASSKDADWDGAFKLAAVATFLLVFGLWWLTFQYSSYTEGTDKAEGVTDALPAHIALPLHFLTTTSIMFMAAGLGELVLEPHESLHTAIRWVTCGGLAAYLLLSQLALAFISRTRPWWLAALGVIVIAAPLVLAGFSAELTNWAMACALALIVGAQVVFRKLDVLFSPSGRVQVP